MAAIGRLTVMAILSAFLCTIGSLGSFVSWGCRWDGVPNELVVDGASPRGQQEQGSDDSAGEVKPPLKEACGGRPGNARGGGGCARGALDDGDCTVPAGGGGEEGSVAKFHFTGTGEAAGLTGPKGKNAIKFDANAVALGGSGASNQNFDAGSICTFRVGQTTRVESNRIEVISALYPDRPDNCEDPQKCVQCTIISLGSSCRIDCDGVIPQTEAADADSLDVTVVFRSDFNTTSPRPPAMIRLDGLADLWPEFLLKDSPPDFITTSGCNGAEVGEMVLNNNDFLDINGITEGVSWTRAFGIDDTSLGGDCTIFTTLMTDVPFEGVLDQEDVSVERGPIEMFSRICGHSDTERDCPGPGD